MARICSGAGCGRKVSDGVRFCDECRKERGQAVKPEVGPRTHTTGYDNELDTLRKGARWQRTRAKVLVINPFCRGCGGTVPAVEVDHIVPAREAIAQARASGGYPFDKYAGYYLVSNLQGLCRSCHAKKTIEDKRHVGPWSDVMANERRSREAGRKQLGVLMYRLSD